MKVKILSAEIKDGLFLKGEYTEDLIDHHKHRSKFVRDVPIHEDLKNAIQGLHKHLVIIFEEIKPPSPADFASVAYEGFECYGFAISGKEDGEGVELKGFKLLKLGAAKMDTPSVKFTERDYKFSSELAFDVQTCIDEVEAYLFDGKRAPDQQLGLPFGEDPQPPKKVKKSKNLDETLLEDDGPKPKKGRKQKTDDPDNFNLE